MGVWEGGARGGGSAGEGNTGCGRGCGIRTRERPEGEDARGNPDVGDACQKERVDQIGTGGVGRKRARNTKQR